MNIIQGVRRINMKNKILRGFIFFTFVITTFICSGWKKIGSEPSPLAKFIGEFINILFIVLIISTIILLIIAQIKINKNKK
jgi:hypothetical protein